MGLDINGTQFVLYAKTLGVDFVRTATIGRQGLHLSPSDLKANLLKFGFFSFDDKSVERIITENNHYAEGLFRSIGSEEVHSLDCSDYEGATYVHDMNTPIPGNLKRQYSVVLDGGSLEHIFNFPVAIKNCMEMVRVGGHYLAITPANNFMGHGFYQFSPELFFGIFSPSNGYELNRLIAFEDNPNSEWYLVKKTASVKSRITLINSRPVYLLVVAKRIEDIEPFRTMPQQSDYTAVWNMNDADGDAVLRKRGHIEKKRSILRAIARRYIPRSIKRIAKLLLRRSQQNLGFDPRFFIPLVRTESAASPCKTLQPTR